MIQVKAMENREEERKLLDAAGVEGRVLSMKDGGQEVGYVIVDLQEGTLLLRKLAAKWYDFTQPPRGEELFILATLMRAAASWGEDHGADAIATCFPDFFGFFKARGFTVDEEAINAAIEAAVNQLNGGNLPLE